MNVTVVDYGVGNLRSLRRGLERAGAAVEVTDDRAAIADADALVLPGVGAFRECVRNSRPYHDLLREKAGETPLLGICVGYQLLAEASEEGADGGLVEGLGLLPGTVRRLPAAQTVPHMGWNTLDAVADHPLVDGIGGDHAYFVHSYCTPVDGPDGAGGTALATCDYGVEFAAVGGDGPVMGTQFHPEKSGETGLRLLANFVDVCESWEA